MVSSRHCLAVAKCQIITVSHEVHLIESEEFSNKLCLNCTTASVRNYCKKFVSVINKSNTLLVKAILHTQDLKMVWAETSSPN